MPSVIETIKPTVLLIPGSWHDGPATYGLLQDELAARGYPSETLSLPCNGAEPPTKNMFDDVAVIRATLQRLVDDEKEVVVLMHSYSGVPGSSAMQGLGARQRAAAGKRGGIVLVTYLASFLLPRGVSLNDFSGGQLLPWMTLDGLYAKFQDETVTDVFYNDLSAEAQALARSNLRPHICWNAYTVGNAYEPWNDITCMYIHTKKDQAIPLEWQQKMVAMFPGCHSFYVDGSHCAMLSVPGEVADAIELGVQMETVPPPAARGSNGAKHPVEAEIKVQETVQVS